MFHPVRRLSAVLLVAALVGCADSSTSGSSTTSATDADGAKATFTFRPLDAGGKLTEGALKRGDIDIALLFSSNGAIADNKWVALNDDKHLQPVDNFVPAIRTEVETDEIAAVLDEVMGALTNKAMQAMVARVSVDGEDPADVATSFLDDKELPASDAKATGELVVGSADFAESRIAAALFGAALERAGVTVTHKDGIGSREVYLKALEKGDIDLVPEFVGTLLTYLKGEPTPDLDETLAAARAKAEPLEISLLEPSKADSVNTLVVTAATAAKYELADISDLANVPDALVFGGPPECPKRQPCILGLQSVYGLKFKTD